MNTYGTIIHETNFHHGLKNSIFDLFGSVKGLDLGEEVIIEQLGFLRLRSSMEVRFVAFPRVCQKGKL